MAKEKKEKEVKKENDFVKKAILDARAKNKSVK